MDTEDSDDSHEFTNEDDGGSNDATHSKESYKKRVIGAKMIAKINRMTTDGKKICVRCNRLGKGVNKNSTLMQSYIGYLARTCVSIEYPKWKAIPIDVKTKLYQTIETSFDIPPTMTQKMVLRSAGDKWKNFKNSLGKYLVDNGVFRAEPPSKYPFITQEAWEAYVQHRCTKEFQDLSRTNTEHAKQNNYRYRLSRMGYARKERKMLKEQNKDPDTCTIPRAELWKAARQDLNGRYHDDETAQVAKKIDMYIEQQSQGIIKLTPAEDALTLALEKDEHYGRVRAAGFGVSKKMFFGATKSREAASKQEVALLRNEVGDLRQQMAEFVRNFQNPVSSQSQVSQPPPIKTTNHVEIDIPLQEKPQEVMKSSTLFWPNKTREVAKGRAFIPQGGYTSVLHCRQLNSNDVLKVNLDTVLPGCGEVPLPYPIDDINCLSYAIGYIIGWPSSLVVVDPESVGSTKGSRASVPEPMQVDNDNHPQPHQRSDLLVHCLSLLSKDKKFLMDIDMQKGILQHTHKLSIGNDELGLWIQQEEVEAVHISFYIRFLFDKYKPTLHSFLCPTRLGVVLDKNGSILQSKDGGQDMRVIYMTSSICQGNASHRLWLAPYNSGNHWMLAMINPQLNTVYWLDPLRGNVPLDFANMCTRALKTFQVKVLKSKLSTAISWINIKKCPLQPNSVLCGFYICRMMRDIIEQGAKSIPELYFSGSVDSYTQGQIDEVMDEWLQHLQPHLQMVA